MAKLGFALQGIQSLIGEGEILGDPDFHCQPSRKLVFSALC